jgi:hypothetical protein
MASQRPSHEYVLGTHGVERDRLALQHALWVDEARQGWRAAGIDRAVERPDSMIVAPTLLEVVAVRR